jgi:hypothetical protein
MTSFFLGGGSGSADHHAANDGDAAQHEVHFTADKAPRSSDEEDDGVVGNGNVGGGGGGGGDGGGGGSGGGGDAGGSSAELLVLGGAGGMTMQQQIQIAAEQRQVLQKRAQLQRNANRAAAPSDVGAFLQRADSAGQLPAAPAAERGRGLGMEMTVQQQIAVADGDATLEEIVDVGGGGGGGGGGVGGGSSGDALLHQPTLESLKGKMFTGATGEEGDNPLALPLKMINNLAPANAGAGGSMSSPVDLFF